MSSGEFFDINFGNILSWIISVIAIGAVGWRVIDWQKKRENTRAIEKEQKEQETAGKLRKYTDEENRKIVSKIDDVDQKVTTQLKRQSRRSDFTNSNVRKVRMDAINLQRELYIIKTALIEKQIIDPRNNGNSQFEREMKRKIQEIEDDEKQQTPEYTHDE